MRSRRKPPSQARSAGRESACKVCRCLYYLGAIHLTAWKRLVEDGGTHP